MQFGIHAALRSPPLGILPCKTLPGSGSDAHAPLFCPKARGRAVCFEVGRINGDRLVVGGLCRQSRHDPGEHAHIAPSFPAEPTPDAPLSVLVPSFLLSEIARAFQVGFLVFLPFLIIDLVVAAILMSMGMMMVPPAIVSLPFKLAFFVVADGWSLIAGSLVRSYF